MAAETNLEARDLRDVPHPALTVTVFDSPLHANVGMTVGIASTEPPLAVSRVRSIDLPYRNERAPR